MDRYEFYRGRVSIVTPVYNGESHLSRMLDSVLRQTYKNIDMILVDDGSSDRTIRIAESYYDKFRSKGIGFRLIRAEHKCAAAAINQGLPYVDGEYLIWPDSDDVLEPASIEQRVLFLREHPQYQCVRSLSYYFNAETGMVSEQADEKTGDLTREDLFWDILESKTFVCCGCYMLRAESFFEIYSERHIPEYNVGQNFQMLLPFMYYHKCPTIPEQLYGVCVRPGSHSRRNLTETEELNKYRYYEELVDEIAEICHIKDKASVNRIRYWKARRRRQIAAKYQRSLLQASAEYELYRCGEAGFEQMLKNIVLISGKWIRKKWDAIDCRRPRHNTRCELKKIEGCKKKTLALSFNAAWGDKYTAQLLRILEKHHVKATFFVNGASLELHPEINREIFRAGHEIGNYTYHYPHMPELSKKQIVMEIDRTQQLIREITGGTTRLFRFPYGESNRKLLRILDRKGLIAVSWTIDSLDWQDISAEQICKNVINSHKLESGAILLMNRSGKLTAEALDCILPALKRMGYGITCVSDLLQETSQ